MKHFPDYIFPVRPDQFDTRMRLQQSCFTFHVPKRPTLTRELSSTLRVYLVPKDGKMTIAKELALVGINDFTLYGDLEGLSRRLRAAYGIP